MHLHAGSDDPAAWAVEAGLAGMSEFDLLQGFCRRNVSRGIPISRALLIVDTLHPVHEGRVFRWFADGAGLVKEYGRTSATDEAAQMWRRSPFHHLDETGQACLRRRIIGNEPDDFSVLADLRDLGQTDYLACVHRFVADGAVGAMDCVYSSWCTDVPGGFDDEAVAALQAAMPSLALAVKCASLSRIMSTLVETYLGRDAGRRVLEGRIERGVAERIGAVVWFSDLKDFTHIADTTDPEAVIPLLNDYAEAVIHAVHEAGGEVLKLVGDGVLAIFQASDPGRACRCALDAQDSSRQAVEALNRRRSEAGLPTTEVYLGLHVGEVFYGNIGSPDRLDFTVVGPAVNEACRIAGLCRQLDLDVLVSSALAQGAGPEDRARFVSVGSHHLRGVAQPRELFTLSPGEGRSER